MTPNEFQKECLRTEVTPDFTKDPALARLLHGAIGLCTEAGELQDALKKSIMYGQPLDLVNIMEESFDSLYYIAVTLDAAGFTMEQAMERGLAKLAARYPGKFSQDKALNRNVAYERKILEGDG